MTANGWLQIALFTALIALLVRPLGGYMTRVFQGERTVLGSLFGPAERLGRPRQTSWR
jgi:K+-transporting ATPase ATPase A chain